jgi:hypothetical protein
VAFILALEESSRAEGIDFHRANGFPSEQDPTEDSPTCTREESEFA